MLHPRPPWQTLRADKLSLRQRKVLIQRIQPILRERLALAISDCLTVMRGRLAESGRSIIQWREVEVRRNLLRRRRNGGVSRIVRRPGIHHRSDFA